MSQRATAVFTCDLCGRDIPDARHAARISVQGSGTPVTDVGPCCAGRTIADLIATANKRGQPAPAAKRKSS